MATSLKMQPPAGVTSVTGITGTQYTTNSDGTMTINFNDVTALLNGGFTLVYADSRFHQVGLSAATGPAVANSVLVVASATISNGSATIAAQPDYMRPLQAVIVPGAAAITAGTVTINYVGNDGVTTADAFSLITATSTNLTLNTTKGVSSITSVVTAGLVGGSTPKIKVGTTAEISVPVPAGTSFNSVAFVREQLNSVTTTIGTISTTALASIAPGATANTTNIYGWQYNLLAPTS